MFSVIRGRTKLANSHEFNDLIISKKSYEETGHVVCKEKFNIY